MDGKQEAITKFFGFACLVGLSATMLISLYWTSNAPGYSSYAGIYGGIFMDYVVFLLSLVLGCIGFYLEAKEIRSGSFEERKWRTFSGKTRESGKTAGKKKWGAFAGKGKNKLK